MEKFKIGDIVARKSYDYDILFKITKINSNGIIELAGLSVRIIADAPDFDLKKISKEEIEKRLRNIEKSRYARINRCYMNTRKADTRKYNNYNFNNQYMKWKKGYNNSNIKQYDDLFNIREQIELDEVNVYKKDTVLKKPGTVLHLDRRFRICTKM